MVAIRFTKSLLYQLVCVVDPKSDFKKRKKLDVKPKQIKILRMNSVREGVIVKAVAMNIIVSSRGKMIIFH